MAVGEDCTRLQPAFGNLMRARRVDVINQKLTLVLLLVLLLLLSIAVHDVRIACPASHASVVTGYFSSETPWGMGSTGVGETAGSLSSTSSISSICSITCGLHGPKSPGTGGIGSCQRYPCFE